MSRRSETPSYSVALRLGEDLYSRARVLAAVRRMPLAELVRQAVGNLLEEAHDLPDLSPRPAA